MKLYYPYEKFKKLIIRKNLNIEKELKDNKNICFNDQILLSFKPKYKHIKFIMIKEKVA